MNFLIFFLILFFLNFEFTGIFCFQVYTKTILGSSGIISDPAFQKNAEKLF